jgi:hypothetical protein
VTRLVALPVVVIVLLLAACGDNGAKAVPETETRTFVLDDQTYTVEQPVGCAAQSGSPIDIESEPVQWLAFGTYERWFDADGCPVRIDVISHIYLAAHCDWQEAQSITIGKPLGASVEYVTPETANRYVWDPNGVIRDVTADRTIDPTELPSTATRTGFSQGQSHLWIDLKDESVLYIVDAANVTVWERDFDAGICS